ncbi:hypothetical protein [Chlorobaculum tepidum]|uniref:hypothetical protein n=1 Tax=Chlorobaculum tepidum TaxID=1097 RepID=UPI0013E8D508|nr:hypothetical protein [Chlorobaculum tepidum]
MKKEILWQVSLICLRGGTDFLLSMNVLAEVQGSFTFLPQQMPHASTSIKNALLEFAGVKPLLSGVWRSCGRWVVSDADGGNGANKVWRELKAHLMICNKHDKRTPGNNALLCCAYWSDMGCKAQ